MHVKVAEESSMVSFPLYDSFSKIGSTVLSGRECNKDVEVCWYAKSKHSDRLCSYLELLTMDHQLECGTTCSCLISGIEGEEPSIKEVQVRDG